MRSMRWLKVPVLVLAAGLFLAAPPSDAQKAPAKPVKKFPTAGLDRIDHRLVIDLMARGRDGQPDTRIEALTFEGRMLVERGDPYVSSAGLQEVPFRVKSWEATAWSDSLGCVIIYRTGDNPQPVSRITSEAKRASFPATFDFQLDFDAIVCGVTMVSKHHGRPKGHGFREVPPTGNRSTSPTITEFEDTVIEGQHPKFGTIYFKPRNCNDQSGRTLHTFTDEQKKNLDLPKAE